MFKKFILIAIKSIRIIACFIFVYYVVIFIYMGNAVSVAYKKGGEQAFIQKVKTYNTYYYRHIKGFDDVIFDSNDMTKEEAADMMADSGYILTIRIIVYGILFAIIYSFEKIVRWIFRKRGKRLALGQ